MQQPKKKLKKPLIVSSVNDPRYIAYQDSLNLYNYSQLQKEVEGNTKKVNSKEIIDNFAKGIRPTKNKGISEKELKEVYLKLKEKSPQVKNLSFEQFKDKNQRLYKVGDKLINNKNIFYLNNGNSPDLYHDNIKPISAFKGTGMNYDYKKPEQEVIIKSDIKDTIPISEPKEIPISNSRPKPKPQPLQIRNKSTVNTLTPNNVVPLQNMDLTTSDNVKKDYVTPTFTISETNSRMSGNGYGSGRNDYDADIDKALRAKESADRFNENIERKYNNSESKNNPKAQERYRKIKNNVNVTPNYAMGGYMRLPKNKRHISPTLLTAGITTGLGFAGNLLNSANQKYAAQDAYNNMIASYFEQKAKDDVQVYDDYPTQGNNNVNYYADGGGLPTSSIKGKYGAVGGRLKPIAEGVEVAEGNTHGDNTIDGQYGITLLDGNTPVAEVEDEEVIVDNERVFSDRLMYNKNNTFADAMKKIANKTNKIERKLNSTKDTKYRNGYERQLAGMKMAEETLFEKQEEVKNIEGEKELAKLAKGGYIPKMALGDEIDMQFFRDLAPSLIDNFGNALITSQTPKLPKPIRAKATQLETNINVQPQLAEISSTTEALNDNILGNVSNSSTARNSISANRLGALRQKLGVLAQKEAGEVTLRNQNKMNQQSVDNTNVNQSNEFNMLEFTRGNDIQSRVSANLGNLNSDINNTLTRQDMNKYYEEMMLLDLLDDPTGVKNRTLKRNPYIKMSPMLKDAIRKENNRLKR